MNWLMFLKLALTPEPATDFGLKRQKLVWVQYVIELHKRLEMLRRL